MNAVSAIFAYSVFADDDAGSPNPSISPNINAVIVAVTCPVTLDVIGLDSYVVVSMRGDPPVGSSTPVAGLI